MLGRVACLFSYVVHHVVRMLSEIDHASVVDYPVAGPSNVRAPSSGRRPRKAAVPRRKAPVVPPEDIIEISDSDDDEPREKRVVGSPERRRGHEVGGQAGGTPDRRPKPPLFLPDDDHDSDDDILAILNAEDGLSAVSPRASMSPQHKGKRRADGRPLDNFKTPLRFPAPLSVASTPPASQEDLMVANRVSRLMERILEIIPDVDKSFLEKLIMLQADSRYSLSGSDWGDGEAQSAQIVDSVLSALFENAEYPKSRVSSTASPRRNLIFSATKLLDVPATARAHPGDSRQEREAIVRAGPSSSHRDEPLDVAPARDIERLPSDAATAGSGSRAESLPPQPQPDPMSSTVAQVLEIIPDVDPAYLHALIHRQLDTHVIETADSAVARLSSYEVALQRVLHSLFENPGYPKVSRKRKRSSDEGGEDAEPAKVRKVEETNYGDKDRPPPVGKYYHELALNQLTQDFPDVLHAQILQCFAENNKLYAPSYLVLHAQRRQAAPAPDASSRSSAKRRKGKGKGKARHDPEFEKERAWVLRKILELATNPAGGEEESDGLECGCCFSSYSISKMTQCPDAHLFCVECVTNYAATLLGEHNPAIGCMDQSGCKLLFAPAELRRILTPKLLELYERVSQRKELEAAGLDNLEECPFCEYQVVIENEEEKLFRCEREECGAVSCRKCKKLDHLPKSCEEAAQDKKLDARHAIEEAMTAALMRNCPSCKKSFIKEAGCNKMVCPNCRTMSCYICRQIIHGYEHFNQAPPYNKPKDQSKCPLWDTDVEARHADEVAAAAQKAQDEYKRAHPEVNAADIKVDLPKAPPKRGCNNPHCPQHGRYALPPGGHPVAGPAMAGPVALHRADAYLFRLREGIMLPDALPPAGFDPRGAVAYAQGLPLLAHPPPPPQPLPPNIVPDPLRGRRHRPVVLPPPAPVMPLPAHVPLLRDVRRNPRRHAAPDHLVQIAAGHGVLDALHEGVRMPDHAERAHGRPVKAVRHR
ncbi:hypothetical protein PsYK624_117440 [Phanerochaete sordida]|uniref:RING-type domain-containing protein n=1 Tax=Phanerochaete sordida TaxID=48140 RepID=A0A9P3GII8_9APHY|nr:hypothetical protein PsYK624_117440 [Phanerochaete sordida]